MSTASSTGVKAGPNRLALFVIWTTSFLPEMREPFWGAQLHQALVVWRRPPVLLPILGAPPKPLSRPLVTVEELPR